MTRRALRRILRQPCLRERNARTKGRTREGQPRFRSRRRRSSTSCRATGSTGRPPRTAIRKPSDSRSGVRRSRDAYPGTYLVIPAGRERVRANDTFFRFRAVERFRVPRRRRRAGLRCSCSNPREAATARCSSSPRTIAASRVLHRSRLRRALGRAPPRRRREPRLLTASTSAVRWRAAGAILEELRDAKYPPGACLRGHDDEVDRRFEAERRRRRARRASLGDASRQRRATSSTSCARPARSRSSPSKTRSARCAPARSEREIEAAFWSRARIEANDVGYLTIAAAGEHACTLHWTRNDGALSAGRTAAARRRRRMQLALHGRHHANAADFGPFLGRAAHDLRARLGSATGRHRSRGRGQRFPRAAPPRDARARRRA